MVPFKITGLALVKAAWARLGWISLTAMLITLTLYVIIRATRTWEANGQELPNFHCVNAAYYRGAQPTPAGIGRLAQMGIRTIIDLRSNREHIADEARLANTLGLRYYNIPLSSWAPPSDAQAERFLQIVQNPSNGPVFVHCRRGSERTGVMSAVYRIVQDGWDAAQAYEEMKRFGFRRWEFRLRDYVYNYARKHEQAGDRFKQHAPPTGPDSTAESRYPN